MIPIADDTATPADHPAAAMRSHGGWVRTFGGVFVAVWSTFTAFGVVAPVIPRLVIETLHGSATMVGAAFATAAVVALLLRPFAGQLAQRLGTRWVMVLGAALAAATGAAYAMPVGAPGLLAARVGMGVAEALVMTAGSVWAVSLAPPRRRGQVVGWYGLSMWGGLTAGPALGEVAFRVGSYPLAWALAAALPGVALLVLACLPRGELVGQRVSPRLLPPAAVLPGLALAAGAFGYASVTSFGALAVAGLVGGVIAGVSYPAVFALSAALALTTIAAGTAAARRGRGAFG